jgi:hypothetical protein
MKAYSKIVYWRNPQILFSVIFDKVGLIMKLEI